MPDQNQSDPSNLNVTDNSQTTVSPTTPVVAPPTDPTVNSSAVQQQSVSTPFFPTEDIPSIPVIPDFQTVTTETSVSSNPTVQQQTVSSDQQSGSAAPIDTPTDSFIPSVSSPKKRFGGGRVIATILGLFLLIGGVGAGIVLTQQPQLLQPKADSCASTGSTRCSGGNAQVCVGGNWQTQQTCTNGCSNGSCSPAATTNPTARPTQGPTERPTSNPTTRPTSAPSCTANGTCLTSGSCCGGSHSDITCPGTPLRCGPAPTTTPTNPAASCDNCTLGNTRTCTIGGGPGLQTCINSEDCAFNPGRGDWNPCISTATGSPQPTGTVQCTRLTQPGNSNSTSITVTQAMLDRCRNACSNGSLYANKYTCSGINLAGGCQDNGQTQSASVGSTISVGSLTCGTVQIDVGCKNSANTWGLVAFTTRSASVACSSSTTPPGTNPPGGPTAQCVNIKAYDDTWALLSATQLSDLKAGANVNFCVTGSATAGSFDMAKFTINSVAQTETTTHRPSSQDFCQTYTIPAAVTTFNITAQIHHITLGWK